MSSFQIFISYIFSSWFWQVSFLASFHVSKTKYIRTQIQSKTEKSSWEKDKTVIKALKKINLKAC